MNEIATLGGGCFWCIEAAVKQLDGIVSAVSGYCGGHLDHPDYRAVCEGDTGHVEVVRFEFDATRIDYRTLLLAFFTAHDPTTPNRQGHDIGSQYRSAIFVHSETQARIAQELIAELGQDNPWGAPIVTEVLPAPTFWPAETYHQDYFENNPHQAYCAAVVAPKVAKLRAAFKDRLKR